MAAFAIAAHSATAQTIVQGPSSSRTPYLVPAYAGTDTIRNVTSIVTATDLVPLTGAPLTSYEMAGLMDGLGAYDNGDGTVTILATHEINTGNGVVRRHGARGTFITELIVDKLTLQVISASDLMDSVVEASGVVRNVANANPVSLGRFCSADLPAVTAFFNPKTGLGTTDRIFLCGEEFAGASWLLGHVATGAEKGLSYVLPEFNLATNGSGINAVGSWENALANPFPQDLTIVVATNDGGSGVQNNRVSCYVGTKQSTGTAVDKAGLKNGQGYFIQVVGNPVEIVNNTTRVTNITNGLRFVLDPTVGTQFSRPEDGHWNPINPREFWFVTTDRLDTLTSGVANPTSGATGTAQNGVSRLWRLTFDDISNPTAGGSIDLVINGVKNNTKVQMLDNMCVADDGNIFLTEDPGNSTYIAKTWIYDPAKDTLVQLAKFDPARWGDLAINGGTPGALAPHTNDKEISGVIDVTSFLPGMPGETVLLLAAQDHSTNAAVANAATVEGGQLMLMKVAPGARVIAYGVRCGQPGLSLLGDAGSQPAIGSTMVSAIGNVPTGSPALMSLGLSNTVVGGNLLPIALDSYGLTGCFLYHDAAIALFDPCLATGVNTAQYSLTIPNSPVYVGLKVYQQAWSPSIGANPAGLIGSNALQLTIGL